MTLEDVPRERWPAFLETFGRQHRAWLATIDAPAGSLQGGIGPRPLAAVASEQDGRRVSAIEISFAGDSSGDTVRVKNPAAVRVRRTDEGGDRALEIIDEEGVCTRIVFRAAAIPETLDGLAPGEQ